MEEQEGYEAILRQDMPEEEQYPFLDQILHKPTEEESDVPLGCEG